MCSLSRRPGEAFANTEASVALRTSSGVRRVTRNQVSRRWNATAAGLGLRIGERQEYRDFSF
jgi:hypothetical protein